MNASLNIVIEVIVFALVVALVLAGMRMTSGMMDVRRRLGTDQAASRTAPSAGVMRSDAKPTAFVKWVQRTTSDDKDKDKH